ncbi:ROK family protein [Catellatospora sp. KI3]|uniref:ROK family protein n=1 Tax=Catellatospora sp. KI3 TaxID=3041620 RepID=UPI002482BB38|nr:ROK family protein [Catellatospora sp. KI3]MDI1461236.1 ROK family protein [Catellatospora sp. KI3]
MSAVLAVDIGGTTFAAAAVRADRTIVRRVEVPIGADPSATLADLIGRFDPRGLLGVGIGSAGPLDAAAGTVSPVNIAAWRDYPLTSVAGALTGLPVGLAGDAQCMALGEYWHGAAAPSMLGVVVSTGIGGGLVLDGEPYFGRSGNAGHIGHISIDPAGPLCPCGATGCVETVASGPSMTAYARANGWTGPDARALAADARAGDPVARLAFARGATALATAILTTAALVDLDTVVVGGGVAAAGEVLFAPLRRALAEQAGLGFLQRVTVTPTSLDRDAGLYGAAALAFALAGVPV